MNDQSKDQGNKGGGLRKSSEENKRRYLALRCPEQTKCVWQLKMMENLQNIRGAVSIEIGKRGEGVKQDFAVDRNGSLGMEDIVCMCVCMGGGGCWVCQTVKVEERKSWGKKLLNVKRQGYF